MSRKLIGARRESLRASGKLDDATLDRAIAQVRAETPDPAGVEAAAARVWERLAAPEAATAAPEAHAAALAPALGPTQSIHGCGDFRGLIPAYLAGELPPARALLLEDHTRECLSCRRALKEARNGEAATPAAARRPAPSAAPATPRWRTPLGLALAATLALALGLGLFALITELVTGGARMASVQAVQGDLFRVDDAGVAPVAAGDPVAEGEDIRTAKGSTAVLRMADGSLIEMNERAELSLDAGFRGNTIRLDRGQVIVQAAKQRRHLYVATPDALVSVTGTIFTVNRGTKGSRVSVVEGEVRVEQARLASVLHPGQQVTTHASVERVPVAQEIAWSRDRDRYLALLGELGDLAREVDARLAWPGLRTSTHLLDLAPAGTMVWVALPNLAENLGETQRSLDERLQQSDLLRQWWAQTMRSPETERRFRELIGRLEALGRDLGDEVAVAVTAEGPVGLAEVSNPAALRAVLEEEIARAAAEGGKAPFHLVTDPAAAAGEGVFLWVGDDLLAVTPKPALLSEVAAADAAGGGAFRGSRFHDRVAEAYSDGAGWLFAADAKRVIDLMAYGHAGRAGAAEESAADTARAEALGVFDVEHFVVDHRETAAGGQTLAALSFDRPRRGVASWLAAPGPMGSLDFISPEANLAAAFVVKDPTAMLDDLLAAVPEMAEALAKLRSEHGIDLREDLAAPLGGEVAFAVDGPLLPEPSWKLVLEVYDPARLQTTLKRLAAEAGREGGPSLALSEEVAGGRTFYTLRCTAEGGASKEVHYVYVDGYLVAAPSRALLERAIQLREAGATLVTSAVFRELLPADVEVNFSALLFHNLGDALAPIAGRLQGMAGTESEGMPDPARLIGQLRPTLAYAYAGADAIQFASSSRPSPLGLNLRALAGFGGLFGMVNGGAAAAEAKENAAGSERAD